MQDKNYDRKSSSATVVPPLKGTKKTPAPLKIDCKNTDKRVFYDTGSMKDTDSRQDSSLMESIKTMPSSIFYRVRNTLNSLDKTKEYPTKPEPSRSGKVIRHSYSDPRLSPGSTAVGDDEDEERQGYFSSAPNIKKKRSPRGWVAAVMMIVVGALIAITFVLVGLGKALDSKEPNSKQHATTTTVFFGTLSTTNLLVTTETVTKGFIPTSSIATESIATASIGTKITAAEPVATKTVTPASVT